MKYITIALLLLTSILYSQNEIGVQFESSIGNISEGFYSFDNITYSYGAAIFWENRFDNTSMNLEAAYVKTGLESEAFEIDSEYFSSRWIISHNLNNGLSFGGGFSMGPRLRHSETIIISGQEIVNQDPIVTVGFDFNLIAQATYKLNRFRLSLRTVAGVLDQSFDDETRVFNSYPVSLILGYNLN